MDKNQILETIKMLDEQNLDVRTVTMGISLFDCISDDPKVTREKIYNKICTCAKDLVKVADETGRKYAIPIVNKRIAVTPISLIAGSSGEEDYVEFAKTLDKAAKTVGVDFIGGFTALAQKGLTKSDITLIKSLPKALAETDVVCASVNVGSTRTGINMDVVKELGHVVKETAYLTRENESIGCAKLVVFANAVDDNPFMAGAFHGVGERENSISVGVSGPGVVKVALEKVKGKPFDDVCNTIQKTAFKITRIGELIGREVSERLNIPFNIVDLSLAPTAAVGDSVARILEEMGLERVGTHGTTCALALLNDAVKKGGVMASTNVGGLSGAFIPVSEDEGMIEAARIGSISLDKLEAMTCVCSVGLDMIAIPGDTPAETISAMIADEAAIGVINAKTTAVRVIPAYGKTLGDEVEFGGLLGKAPIMAVNKYSSEDFINRGGRIPAPIHSFKN
ncbi:MAG: PFL family protein [Tissierellia bacterium]|nr:PFL family protein [Tissierellia bacterium]